MGKLGAGCAEEGKEEGKGKEEKGRREEGKGRREGFWEEPTAFNECKA